MKRRGFFGCLVVAPMAAMSHAGAAERASIETFNRVLSLPPPSAQACHPDVPELVRLLLEPRETYRWPPVWRDLFNAVNDGVRGIELQSRMPVGRPVPVPSDCGAWTVWLDDNGDEILRVSRETVAR